MHACHDHVCLVCLSARYHVHLVVEHLALAGLGLGNEAVVEDVQHILADLLELQLDLLAVFADDADVLVRALGLLFLLDAGDDTPRRTARADDVLVRDREEIALVHRQLAPELRMLCQYLLYLVSSKVRNRLSRGRRMSGSSYLRNFLFHVSVSLSENEAYVIRLAHLHEADHLCDHMSAIAPPLATLA